jgi:acyl-CoA thioesterase II
VFGGQVAAQALIAAGRETPEDRVVHSLHSYFIRPSLHSVPIEFRVEPVRDGTSFSVRRVVAEQAGEVIFFMSASFQLAQAGIEHQRSMPVVPGPEDLPDLTARAAGIEEVARFWGSMPQPFDIRYITDPPWIQHAFGPDEHAAPMAWIRAKMPLGPMPRVDACALAYISDINIADPVLLSHGLDPRLDPIGTASLDHAIWFHRPFRADDWLLFVGESPSASAGRGLSSARYFSRDGRLIASVMQESLVRFTSS